MTNRSGNMALRMATTVLMLLGFAVSAMGEEKICAPNPCETESPFHYSLKNSVTTYVGTFELRRAANGGEVQEKTGGNDNLYITFLPKYEIKKASRNIP